MRNVTAVLAGGLIAFIWSSISWMAIPWHQPTMSIFEEPGGGAGERDSATASPGRFRNLSMSRLISS